MSNPELSLLSDRSHLSARESIKAIIRSAQTNDNRWLSRMKASRFASRTLSTVIVLSVAIPVAHYFTIGGWQSIHPRGFFYVFELHGRPYRLHYTPEIYYREQADSLLKAHFARTESTLKLWT